MAGVHGNELSNIGNLTVENNIVDIETTDALKSIQAWDGGEVQAFNNRRSTGELIEVYNPTTSRRVSELTTEAENVLLGL